jgi:hypothetical protein
MAHMARAKTVAQQIEANATLIARSPQLPKHPRLSPNGATPGRSRERNPAGPLARLPIDLGAWLLDRLERWLRGREC